MAITHTGIDGTDWDFDQTTGVFSVGMVGGTDTFTIDGGNTVELLSDVAGRGPKLIIGEGEGATGTVIVSGTESALTLTGAKPLLDVSGQGNHASAALTIEDGAIVTLAGGVTRLSIGTPTNADAYGGGSVDVHSGGQLVFAGTTSNTLNVGGSLGVGGSVNLGGGTLSIGGAYSDMPYDSPGRVSVGGAGSKIDGVDRLDVMGELSVFNGGVVGNTGADINIDSGGILTGRGGRLVGDVNLTGGSIDLRDHFAGTLRIDDLTVKKAGSALFLDVAAVGGNDRLIVDGTFHKNVSLAVTINAVNGYKFLKGQIKTIATFNGPETGDKTYSLTVTGQQDDFSFYVGKLGANQSNVVVQALNNGNAASAANAGVLDFFAAGSGRFVYDSLKKIGEVSGGRFGAEGGHAVRVDDVRGTNGADRFSVTGTKVQALKFDGRGGNDLIKGGAGADTIKGGAGNDSLLGSYGNDILTGDGGRDLMTGGLGNDTFTFKLKTDSSANHSLADIIVDFDNPGSNDRIDVSALYGPKMTYIHDAAFTGLGQVRINDIAGPDVIVEVNLSGSLAADFAIRLRATTLAEMTATDFVL